MDIFQSFVYFLGGIVVTMIFQILLHDKIHYILSRIIPPFVLPKERTITGIWKCCYRYPDKTQLKFENQIMRLRQFGPFVVGENLKAGSLKYRHNHRLFGKFKDERYFTGTWENIGGSHIWHGGFQFILDNEGNRMRGKWIGFNSDQKIQSGCWSWIKIDGLKDEKNTDFSDLNAECSTVKEEVQKLMELYSMAWTEKKVDLLPQIFTRDAEYAENVFKMPKKGLGEIEAYWKEKIVGMQDNIIFTLKHIFADENYAVVEWNAEFTDLTEKRRKQIREIAVLTIRENKIASLREYWTSKR